MFFYSFPIFIITDISQYYRRLYTIPCPSLTECSVEVLNNLRQSQVKNMSNAFRFDQGSCEIGRVSPLYGALEKNQPLPKGPNSGHLLQGCLGNCNYFFIRYQSEILGNILCVKILSSKRICFNNQKMLKIGILCRIWSLRHTTRGPWIWISISGYPISCPIHWNFILKNYLKYIFTDVEF